MYLSRLILNPRHRAVWRDLSDVHAMHRTVMSGFPNVAAEGDARGRLGVLYRLETHARTGEPTLLVQSAIAPNWQQLPAGYLLDDGRPNPDCKEVGPIFDRLQAGMALTFRLHANPTRRLFTPRSSDGSRPRGKRVELRTEKEQLNWLARKGTQHGFSLVSVRATAGSAAPVPAVRTQPRGKVVGRRPAGARMTFAAVTFDGVLRITDAERFRQALTGGIGSGKSYGFGLLSIAPAPPGVG